MFLNFCNNISSPSILVIDDELQVLNMLERFLTRKGFIVDTASNGEEGIKKIDLKNYTLILTDIKMSGISGRHVLSHIKGREKNSIPVIGMSGTPWLLEQNNFDAVIQKPCLMKEALVVINQLIKI